MQRGKARPKTSRPLHRTDPAKIFTWAGTTVPPRMPSVESQIFTTLQTLAPNQITSTGTNIFGALYFTGGALDQFSSLGTVFDQFRIDEVEVTFRPVTNSDSTAMPLFLTAIDLDDAASPSNIAYLDQYSNVCTTMYETQVRRWKPAVPASYYQPTTSGYGERISPWIDCASSGVQHYGLKYALSPTVSNACTVLYSTRLKVSFRSVH
jgi:hypothetical protein